MLIRPNNVDEISNPEVGNVDIEPLAPVQTKSWDRNRQHWLYALILEKNRYYVGYTAQWDPYNRIMQHIDGSEDGAQWTRRYKPLDVVQLKSLGACSQAQAKAMEQNLTWEYVKRYGIKNVRGGNINYPGVVIRMGDKYLPGYLLSSIVVASLFTLSMVYILLRHKYNWW